MQTLFGVAMNPATVPAIRDTWVATVNTHGNEDACLDVFPGPFLGSRPLFIMERDGEQYVSEGYWFDNGDRTPLEYAYTGTFNTKETKDASV